MNKISNFKYIPSYVYNNANKYKELTEKYEAKLILFSKKLLTNNVDIFNGVNEIAKYIESSFYFNLNQKFELKKPQEKVIYAIFYRYVKYIGSQDEAINNLKEKIKQASEDSIYYSLGFEKYKKRNLKWDCESNFIRHTINSVFIVLLTDILKEIEYEMDSNKEDLLDPNNQNYSTNELIETYKMPVINKNNIKKYLEGDIKKQNLNEKDLFYLNKIYQEIK